MGTLQEDIKSQASWITMAFAEDGLKLDYTITSLKQVDKFFEKHSKNGMPVKNGRLSQNLGPILFSIGSYVGETIIKNAPGAYWKTDDNDPEGELNAAVILPDGGEIWPIQRVAKRYSNGAEDSVYVYGHMITRPWSVESLDPGLPANAKKKPWWKFF